MTDSVSCPKITIIRNAGTPQESRYEGTPAHIQGNRLIIDGAFKFDLKKYDEMHTDYLDEPYVVTLVNSRKLPENRTAYEVEITPHSVYRTTYLDAVKTAGKKFLPKDTLVELRLGDFPGTLNIILQFPGKKDGQDFIIHLLTTI
jgi:hypothetical protein